MSSTSAELLHGLRPAKRRVLLLAYHRDGVEMIPMSRGVPVVVGREPPADLVVHDISLSRRHASFTLAGEEVVVEDLGSRNGTHLGGQRVDRAVLRPGDEVRLGALFASIHVFAGAELPLYGLDSHDALRGAMEAEIVRSRHFGRRFALLVVRSPADQDSRFRQFCVRVREALRPVDRVARYSGDTLEILLPEVTSELAMELARGIVRRWDGDPPLACGVALFPDAATWVDLLSEMAHDAARQASAEEPVKLVGAGPLHYVSPEPAVGAPSTPERLAQPHPAGEQDGSRIVTRTPEMRAVIDTALRAARSSIPLLLHGETGTGKELLARLIHERSPRSAGPLVCVNCGAIPALLVESTLFGHERGAFTGANQQQKGVFEAASGGTVLLDEIGELPATAQTALLRVLEAKRVTRVGSTREIEVDVRVLAATHRDLEAMCDAGSFRLDLLFRLNTLVLKVPPLRQRRDDIALLCAAFLRQADLANHGQVRGIAPEALALLESYPWPGNVRELRNAIERAVVIAEGELITVRDLPERLRSPTRPPMTTLPSWPPEPSAPMARPAEAPRSCDAPAASAPAGSMKARLEQAEAEIILETLRETEGNQSEAARRLDMPLRTLQHKLRAYGIKKSYGVPK